MLPLLAEIRTDAPIRDERSAARRTLRLEVSAHSSGDATRALIHNLSEAGLLLETSADLMVGEALQVDIPHAGTTTALVVWCRGSFAGCEFVSPVSKGAVSAALLQSPVEQANQPGSAPTPLRRSEVDVDPFRDEQTIASAVLLSSLLVATAIAFLLTLALLTFPFSAAIR